MTTPPNTDPPKADTRAKPRCGKGSGFHGKKGRSGPRRGNVNAIRNGAGISRTRLVVGELPKELLSVRREGRTYRRKLETAVLEAKGDINILDAHLIDTASAATIAGGICRWVLRHKLDGMKGSDLLACSREIIKAKQARDAAVKALDLNAPPPNPWEAIDVQSEESDEVDDDDD